LIFSELNKNRVQNTRFGKLGFISIHLPKSNEKTRTHVTTNLIRNRTRSN